MANEPIPRYATVTDSYLARRKNTYPHRMFSLAEIHLPKEVSELYEYCVWYFSTNALVHPTIVKLAEYAVTRFEYGTKDDEDRQRAERLFEKVWHMRKHLIELGIYTTVFGTCYAPVIYSLRRFLECPHCEQRFQVLRLQYEWRLFEFHAECPTCRYRGQFRVRDVYPQHENFVRPLILDPRHVTPRYNPLTNRSHYLYSIPKEVRQRIRRGDPYILNDTPWPFIEAVRKRKKVELDPACLYAFIRPGLAPSNHGLGMPLIQPVMQDLFYRSTLKRGQEAIALGYITPLLILFPQQYGTTSPVEQMDLSQWKTQVEKELRKWKVDPNRICVFPVPMGVEAVGGNARALLITPELEANKEDIVNGMGLPIDVLKGMMTWSGGSVTLRMIENVLLNHREDLNEYLAFAGDRGYSYLNWKSVPVSLAKFRMADDQFRMQLLHASRVEGDVSGGRWLEEMGEDPDREHERRMEELDPEKAYQSEHQKVLATAQGEGSIVAARYQQRAQKALLDEQNDAAAQEIGLSVEDPRSLAALVADLLLQSPPDVQGYALEQLQGMPTLQGMVFEELQLRLGGSVAQEGVALETPAQTTGGGADPYAAEVAPPLPEQLPPRRQGAL